MICDSSFNISTYSDDRVQGKYLKMVRKSRKTMHGTKDFLRTILCQKPLSLSILLATGFYPWISIIYPEIYHSIF
jgi:hypothetical protein